MQQIYKQHEKEVFGDQLEAKDVTIESNEKTEKVQSKVNAALIKAAASEVEIAPAAAV